MTPREAVRLLRQLSVGPATLHPGYPFDDLTDAQRAKVMAAFRLWWDSWAAPAIDIIAHRLERRR